MKFPTIFLFQVFLYLSPFCHEMAPNLQERFGPSYFGFFFFGTVAKRIG